MLAFSMSFLAHYQNLIVLRPDLPTFMPPEPFFDILQAFEKQHTRL